MIWNGYWQSCGYGWPTDWDELNPEEEARVRLHFKKLNPDIDFNERLDEPKK